MLLWNRVGACWCVLAQRNESRAGRQGRQAGALPKTHMANWSGVTAAAAAAAAAVQLALTPVTAAAVGSGRRF